MVYVPAIASLAQGIGVLMMVIGVLPFMNPAENKEFVFGPVRFAVCHPTFFYCGLALLGAGMLVDGILTLRKFFAK